MDVVVYRLWNKLKTISKSGTGTYHCSDKEDIKHINTLINAGYITVSWKTALDAVFHIVSETE